VTDLAGWKVHGPVRTLRTEFAEWDPADATWQAPRRVSAVMFRPDGQISDSETRNPDGSVARSARVYDVGGRIIEAQTWMDGGPRSRVLHSYDPQGRPMKTVQVAWDGTQRQIDTCGYDAAGHKTKITSLLSRHPDIRIPIGYGVEGSELAYGAPGAATLTITYDDRGLPAEACFHGENGEVIRRIVFSRDSDGHVLTEVVYFGGEAPFPELLTQADNVPLEERAKMAALLKAAFAEQVFSSVAYAYDAKGRLVERTMRMGALSEERTTFQYDDFDNPVAETSESRACEMRMDDDVARTKVEGTRVQHHRFDYQYDAHGNWIERVVWSRTGSQAEFHRSNIERRTIAYYQP
jgi:hypothetical protein